jgi:transglutaminase-like putative cysteine protease
MKKSFLVLVSVLIFAGAVACGPGTPDTVSLPTTTTALTPTTTNPTTPTPTPKPISVYTNPVVYHVTRTLTITNTDATVELLRVWLPSVVAWDSQTNVNSIRTIPNPISVWEDAQYGNGGLYWEFRNEISKGSSVVINDEFTYICYQVSYNVDPSNIGSYDKTSSIYQLFTRPEKYVESDDAQIMAIAGQIQQGETNSYATAGAIYDWVIDNMTYRDVEGLKGAKFALENGYGECGDYSALFTALCRAAGIPARTVVGRWATSSPNDWHVWAEFYLPRYGWLPVDPTVADGDGRGRAYFGNLDNKRLILHKGFTIVLQPTPIFFEPDVGFLQLYCWEYQGVEGQAPIQTEITYTIDPQPT